jgi:hypothetical protein
MNASDEQKYQDYVEMLEDVNLVRYRNNEVIADDIFIEIQASEDKHHEMLNTALAHFFRTGAEELETIRSILGPYLILSSYYYSRALEVDGFPQVPEKEFQEQIANNYAGNNRVQKKFKLARYLIQLEEVGLLESRTDDGGVTTWEGKDEVKSELLRQEDLLAPISEVMA